MFKISGNPRTLSFVYNLWNTDNQKIAENIPDKQTANLFAAAPELLEALEAAEQYLTFHSSPGVEPQPLQKARAAIAKAKS